MLIVYILLIILFAFILIDRIMKLIESIKEKSADEIAINAVFLILILIICTLLGVLIEGMQHS